MVLLVAGAGCRGEAPQVDLEERRVRQAAYQQQLAALPDSGQTPVDPLDSLFIHYDDAVLRALRPDTADAARWVDSTLQALTLEEKIGQLFIVRLPERDLTSLFDNAAKEAIRQGVGGFLVSRVLAPREVYRQVRPLQPEAEVPLFFAADYERGAGRFSNAFTELPANMALGAARDTLLAAAAGRLTALESRAVGVNLLFAPVVDVNNNPANPIINIRSYGEDPQLVGRMATAFVRAAQAQGLLTTLKHFPGHGNTSIDTHAQMGAVPGSRGALRRIELAPYRMVLQALRPAAVMTAHLWIQALDEEPLPATFSRAALSGLLREQLGFDGLIVTDDIRMGALQDDYTRAERVLRPLRAGADVLLLPEDLEAAVDIVRQAVAEGRLSEARLERSVRRILRAKARAGLHRRRVPSEDVLDRLLEEPRGEVVAQTIADSAVTLLKTGPALPLRDGQQAALVQLSNYRDSESIDAAMNDFEEALGGAVEEAEFRFEDEVSAADREDVLEAARRADVVVLALYLRLTSGRGDAGLFSEQEPLVEALADLDVPVVLAIFGNPYAAGLLPEPAAVLVAYDQTLASVFAAARVLKGERPPRGRLPVTVGPYGYGSGLQALHPGEAARTSTRPEAGGR